MTNDECRLTNGGIASGFAFGYDPTRRSVVLKWTVRQKTHDRQDTLNPKSAFQNQNLLFEVSFPIRLDVRGQQRR